MNTIGLLCIIAFFGDLVSAFIFPLFPRHGREICPRASFLQDLGPCYMQCSRYRGCRPGDVCCTSGCGGTYCQPMMADNRVSDGCSSLAPRTTCFGSPCAMRRLSGGCQGFPGARCEDDFCGGCNARYFYGDQEVTPMCTNRQSMLR